MEFFNESNTILYQISQKKKRSAKYDVGGIFVQGKISYEDEYIYHNLWIISIQLLKAIIPTDNYLEELSWSKELLNK